MLLWSLCKEPDGRSPNGPLFAGNPDVYTNASSQILPVRFPIMKRETVRALRDLRHKGLIRGYLVFRDTALVPWEDTNLKLDEEGVERLVATIQIWTLVALHVNPIEPGS